MVILILLTIRYLVGDRVQKKNPSLTQLAEIHRGKKCSQLLIYCGCSISESVRLIQCEHWDLPGVSKRNSHKRCTQQEESSAPAASPHSKPRFVGSLSPSWAQVPSLWVCSWHVHLRNPQLPNLQQADFASLTQLLSQ